MGNEKSASEEGYDKGYQDGRERKISSSGSSVLLDLVGLSNSEFEDGYERGYQAGEEAKKDED